MKALDAVRDRIVRHALAATSPHGWLFGSGGVVHNGEALIRLEDAIHEYRTILRQQRKKKRK